MIIEDHADVRPGRRPKYNRLSSSVLRITRRGPDEKNFAIVDIPGLVRGEYYHHLLVFIELTVYPRRC